MSGKTSVIRSDSLTPGRDRRISELAARQHGVISRSQLAGLGLDHRAIGRRLSGGTLHALHDGRVYSLNPSAPTRRALYLAAVLACGRQAALSHRSAADLWNLRPSSGKAEVSAPRGTTGTPGILLRQTRMLDPRDFTVEYGVPVTTVARTLLDLAAVVPANDLEVAIDRAERARILDLRAVEAVLARAKGRRGARALRLAVERYVPSIQKSELEKRFRRLIEPEADIPTPSFNAIAQGEERAHEVDALWERARLAVELDGFDFHRTRRDRERDAARDADLELAGLLVMRLTWDDVEVHGERTLRRLRVRLRGASSRVRGLQVP